MYILLPLHFKILVGALFGLLFIFPIDAIGEQSSRLRILPDKAYTFIMYRHLTRIISLSQLELISEIKKNNLPKDAVVKLDRYLHASAVALEIIDETTPSTLEHFESFPSFDHKRVQNVSLTDPIQQARWLKMARRKIQTTICKEYPATVSTDGEHNFFLFYMHNVQNLCGTRFLWQPPKAFAEHPFIKIFFEQNFPVPHTHIFSRGHRYLESPAHKPFLRGGYRNGIEIKSGRIFIAFYFHYSELALDARHVSLANREFFVRRADLRRAINGFSLVQKLFAALLARGLVG